MASFYVLLYQVIVKLFTGLERSVLSLKCLAFSDPADYPHLYTQNFQVI